MSGERGGITTSARPDVSRLEVSGRALGDRPSPYWLDERQGVPAEGRPGSSSASAPAAAASPSSDDDRRPSRPAAGCRRARTRRSRTAGRRTSPRASETMHVDGRAGQRQHRPGVGPEAPAASAAATAADRAATAMTTTTGSSAATAPLTLIERGQRRRTSSIVRTSEPGPARHRPARRAAGPAQVVTPVASRPSLTTNSVAMKMTAGSPNPASACVERQDARSPTGRGRPRSRRARPGAGSR